MDKEDMAHIYNGILLIHKKNEIISFATTSMDLDIIILNKKRKTPYNLHVESKI